MILVVFIIKIEILTGKKIKFSVSSKPYVFNIYQGI